MISGPEVLCRRLVETDIEALARFFAQNNHPGITSLFSPFPLTRETAVSLLASDRKDLFFALEFAGRFAGFSMLRGYDEGFAIPSLGVCISPEFQHRGLGRHLTQWTLFWAAHSGATSVRLSVFTDNRTAIDLYASLGFSIRERRQEKDGRTSLIMHREGKRSRIAVYLSTNALEHRENLRASLESWQNLGFFRVECGNFPGLTIADLQALGSRAGTLIVHNFFPSAEPPVIMNLASPRESCRATSRDTVKKMLDVSAALGSRYYSIHAGFAADPTGHDGEGFTFPAVQEQERRRAAERFVFEVARLGAYAESVGVRLLVENNVCTRTNAGKVLLSTPRECSDFFKAVQASPAVGLLLDTGHMNVSNATFGVDQEEWLGLKDRIVGVHLHGNDGVRDLHRPVGAEHWMVAFTGRLEPEFVTLEGQYGSLPRAQMLLVDVERTLNG